MTVRRSQSERGRIAGDLSSQLGDSGRSAKPRVTDWLMPGRWIDAPNGKQPKAGVTPSYTGTLEQGRVTE